MSFLLLFMIAVATYSSNSFASFLCSKGEISNYQRGLHIETNLNEFGLENKYVTKIDKSAISFSSENASKESISAFTLKKKLQELSLQAFDKPITESIPFTDKTEKDSDQHPLHILKQQEWLTHIINNAASSCITLPFCSIIDGEQFIKTLLPVTPSGLNYILPTINYDINTAAEWQQYFLDNVYQLAHVCITQNFQVNYNTVNQFLITFKQITQKVNNTEREEEEEEETIRVPNSRFNPNSTLRIKKQKTEKVEEVEEVEEVKEIEEINKLLDKKNYPAFKEKVIIAYLKQALGILYQRNLGEAFIEEITTVDKKEDKPNQPVNIPQLRGVKKTTTGVKILHFLKIASAVLGGGAVCVGGLLFGLKAFLHLVAAFDKHIGLFPRK